MRAMVVRLNIDFSTLTLERQKEKNGRGEKLTGGTCQFRKMIPQPVSDRIVFNAHKQIYMETNKI